MADDENAEAFVLHYCLTVKQQKADRMGPPLVTQQVSNLLVVHLF